MTLLKISPLQKRNLAIAMILAILVTVWFLKFYLMLIIISAIFAYLFYPVHQWFLKHGRSEGQAALLTFLASLLAIIIPIVIVGIITVLQVETLVRTIANGNYTLNTDGVVNSIIDSINHILSNLGSTYHLTVDQLSAWVSAAAESFSRSIVAGILSSASGFFSLITTSIIYIYVFMSMLRHQNKLLETLKKLNPLGDQTSVLYLERMGAMTKATVRGQFIIAVMQGLVSAIVLSIAGLSNLFFFFAMLLSVLSVIPLGAGIVTIPIGIVMILTGNIWQGALVIANHLLIVTNIDNVMRPRLVPASARLDPALMILAVFSGLAYFGFVGIIIGPVLMIVLLTTLQMYLEVYKGTESINRQRNKSKLSVFKRLDSWVRSEEK
jgi:predicted PurR-regulated permease PerM